jgi:replicative DNA helicase
MAGLASGTLTVVGAHPGVGFGSLVLGFAQCTAIRHEVPAAYLSLDAPVSTITQRVLSAEAKIRLTDMRSGRMTDEEWTRLAERMSEISESALVIARPEDPDITALGTTIRDLVATKKARLVITDPLHMVTARHDLPYENREREVAEVSRRLKRPALDTSTAIVATAQNPGPRQPVLRRPVLLTSGTRARSHMLPTTSCSSTALTTGTRKIHEQAKRTSSLRNTSTARRRYSLSSSNCASADSRILPERSRVGAGSQF